MITTPKPLLPKLERGEDTIKIKTSDVTKESLVESTIIHVVSSTQTVAMATFRKFNFLENKSTVNQVPPNDEKLQPPIIVKPDVYHQSKRKILEYKDLFAALMRLPDKTLQKKLLDVINNHRSIEYKTVGTQTDALQSKFSSVKRHDVVSNETHFNECESDSQIVKNASISGEILKKRKRKRKVSLPQANKESRTKQLAKMNKPMVEGLDVLAEVIKIKEEPIRSPKRQRIHSFCISECGSDVANIYEDTETNHTKEIEQCGYPLDNGLLPIQDAVLRNQTNKLRTHILIWQSYKGVDLNDILTDEDEDLLQLAVLNTCDPSIVGVLLKQGLNPNTLDADSNTIVHLAILNDITVASLDHLMKNIDLKLLLILNDDGYTPLHLAVRQDRYLLAECLINILDERLSKKIFFSRPVDELETDEIVLKKQFKDYYESICLQLSVDDENYSSVINNHDLKQKLLQIGDRRSGNTALYFAIDNRLEHLIYFLLAHLTDPRTENLSGLDCKTYFYEYNKSLNLSLNIDITMDKVVKLLS